MKPLSQTMFVAHIYARRGEHDQSQECMNVKEHTEVIEQTMDGRDFIALKYELVHISSVRMNYSPRLRRSQHGRGSCDS